MEAVFLSEDITSYGFWVKLSGLKLDRYLKNPVLLYDHESSRPAVGKVKNLRVQDGQLVGEVEFDENDELGRELKRKYEKGYMSGFSVGLMPLKFSTDEKDMKVGQTRATIVEAELFEISAVNLPADKNAIVLYDKEAVKLNTNQTQQIIPEIKKHEKMANLKIFQSLVMLLALADGATEQQVLDAVKALKADKEKLEEANKVLKEELKAKTEVLEQVIFAYGKERGVINDKNEATFRQLAEKDSKAALELIESFEVKKQTDVKLSEIVKGSERKEIKDLTELSDDEIMKLKAEKPEEYRKLYFQTFGLYPEELTN